MTFVQNFSFFSLPKDTKIEVFDFVLGEEGQLSCREVCKDWKQIVDVFIQKQWDQLLEKKHSYDSVLYLFKKHNPNNLSYLERFYALHRVWEKRGFTVPFGQLKVQASYHWNLSIMIDESLLRIWKRISPDLFSFCYYATDPKIIRSWVFAPTTAKVRSWVTQIDLCALGLKFIPKEIGAFPSLRGIDLSNNHLSQIPSFLGDFESLKVLNLRGNYIKEFPDEFPTWIHIEKINLRDNPLSERGKTQIKEWRKNRRKGIKWKSSSCGGF